MKSYLVVGAYRPTHAGVTHEHITELRYFRPELNAYWKITTEQVIANIEAKTHIYFTHAGGYCSILRVSHNGGNKYLRTSPDGTIKDNLLNLPVLV